MAQMSETWTWYNGDWHEGNVLVAGPRTHAFWLGSSVFDGARTFEGCAPDLDLHCAPSHRLGLSSRDGGPARSSSRSTLVARLIGGHLK